MRNGERSGAVFSPRENCFRFGLLLAAMHLMSRPRHVGDGAEAVALEGFSFFHAVTSEQSTTCDELSVS